MDGPGGYVEESRVTIVGAADDSYKSRIPLSARWVEVASNTNGTDDWVVLPTGVQPGHQVCGWSVVAHEFHTEAGSNIKINDVDGDGTTETAIAATSYWEARYINSTQGWIIKAWTELGAALTLVTN